MTNNKHTERALERIRKEQDVRIEEGRSIGLELHRQKHTMDWEVTHQKDLMLDELQDAIADAKEILVAALTGKPTKTAIKQALEVLRCSRE